MIARIAATRGIGIEARRWRVRAGPGCVPATRGDTRFFTPRTLTPAHYRGEREEETTGP
jgi:hypothetical protein